MIVVVVVLGVIGLSYLGRHQLKSIVIDTDQALANGNVQAFLAMIRRVEGLDNYATLYHPPHSDPLYNPAMPLYFSDMSTHPNIRIPFTNPRTGKRDFSTAAGAYQINRPTWLPLSILPGAPKDFGQSAQDWYAVQLLKATGALDALMQGDFHTAIEQASSKWASLPFTDSKQVHLTLARAQEIYTQNGGMFA